jgi:N-methylhydantoinase B
LFAERRYPKQEIVSGRREVQPPKLFPLKLEQFEIFNQWAGGGSGLGDPLLRDPKAVEKDLRDGYITASHATAVYGVVVDASGNLDSRATETVRERIRRERLAQAKSLRPQSDHSAPSDDARPVFFNLELAPQDGTGTIRCARCHTVICDLGRDWRQSVAMGQHELAPHMRELDVSVEERRNEPLLLVEYFCPSCGTELDCTVGRKGEEDPRDILPDFLKVAASSPGSATD